MHNLDLERLSTIRLEMMDLLEEAKGILRRQAPKDSYNRAKSYWIGHIDTALGGGSYIDTYDHTFLKTLNELGVCQECLDVPCNCDNDGEENPNCTNCDETPCACDPEEFSEPLERLMSTTKTRVGVGECTIITDVIAEVTCRGCTLMRQTVDESGYCVTCRAIREK